MSIDQIFPSHLFEPENRQEFVSVLSTLPVPSRIRKQTYFEYLKLTDQVFNRDEISQIIGASNTSNPPS